LPGSRVPILSASPSRSAPEAVAARSAWAGVMPFFTIRANSRASRPCGSTAESVPNATLTPTFIARWNIACICAAAARALAAMGGG